MELTQQEQAAADLAVASIRSAARAERARLAIAALTPRTVVAAASPGPEHSSDGGLTLQGLQQALASSEVQQEFHLVSGSNQALASELNQLADAVSPGSDTGTPSVDVTVEDASTINVRIRLPDYSGRIERLG